MEQEIHDLIEKEVSWRLELQVREILKILSKNYDIPIGQLIKDTAKVNTKFCRGVLLSKERCLKKPKENGYCGFHQKQVPPPPPVRGERVPAPWE